MQINPKDVLALKKMRDMDMIRLTAAQMSEAGALEIADQEFQRAEHWKNQAGQWHRLHYQVCIALLVVGIYAAILTWAVALSGIMSLFQAWR